MLGTDDTGCNILHVDMDAFFASVELLERPELMGRPVIVGGAGRRSVVLSATYEARARGVHSAMPMSQARSACPEATVIAPRPDRYARAGRQVMELLHTFTPDVEQVSIDEAFLAVGGVGRLHGRPGEIGRSIRREIGRRLGLPCSVGVAARTHVAKIASTAAKPGGVLVVPASEQRQFLAALAVGRLWGIGPKVELRLAELGIDTVSQLLDLGQPALQRVLGLSGARRVTALANGEELRPLGVAARDRSIGAEHTFDVDVRDDAGITAMIRVLADRVGSRMRTAGLVGATVSLKVRDHQWRTLNRSRSLSAPTDVSSVLRDTALAIWKRVRAGESGVGPSPIRLIGVRVEQLRPKSAVGEQLSLDGKALAASSQAAVVDKLAARFGSDTVVAASRLLAPVGDSDRRRVSTGVAGAYPENTGTRR